MIDLYAVWPVMEQQAWLVCSHPILAASINANATRFASQIKSQSQISKVRYL